MVLLKNHQSDSRKKLKKIGKFLPLKIGRVTKRDYLFFSLGLLISATLIISTLLTYERRYIRVKLFFMNSNTKELEIEKECIVFTRNRVVLMRRIIEELIAGPVNAKYERLFVPDVDLQFIAIGNDGVVYVSFSWDFIKSMYKYPPAVVDSLVRSLKANLKFIKGVKILINGVESISSFDGVKLYKVFK